MCKCEMYMYLHIRLFNLNFLYLAIRKQTDIHTHASCNAVSLCGARFNYYHYYQYYHFYQYYHYIHYYHYYQYYHFYQYYHYRIVPSKCASAHPPILTVLWFFRVLRVTTQHANFSRNESEGRSTELT